MSFGFGAISWTALLDQLDQEGVLPLFCQRVAELKWTLPSGQPPDWEALRAGASLLGDPTQEADLDRELSFSGPGMAFGTMYQTVLDEIWGSSGYDDRWTTDRIFLP